MDDAPPDTQWRTGLGDELAFWRAWVEGGGLDWPHDFKNRLDREREFPTWLRRLIEPILGEGETARVLDVGAGPATTLGCVWPGRAFELAAVDPLADAYNALLDSAGLAPPVRTRNARAEDLPAVFGLGAFHLVHCKNALDHTADPVAALRAMVEVTQVGGVVRLEHARNEAQTQGYAGLHQWNLEAEPAEAPERVMLWNAHERIDLGEAVRDAGGTRNVAQVETPSEGWVRVTIRREIAAT